MSHHTAFVLACLVRGLAAVAAVSGAVYLAHAGVDGWGWFLFVGLMCGAGDIQVKA